MKTTIYIISLIAFSFIACNTNDDDAQEILSENTENTIIDLGQIDLSLFEENGKFDFRTTGEKMRRITFSLNKYSEVDFSTDGYNGSFYLFSITENKYISHDGGLLGGGNTILSFYENFNYKDELFPGEYEIVLNANSFIIKDNEMISQNYTLSIKDIDNLRPYENLGTLALPYNATFEADSQRLANTQYEFEILEDTNISIFRDGEVCSVYADAINETYLYNAEREIIYNGFTSNESLSKGTYKLCFNGKRTLILNASARGDIDYGIIADFPKNIDFNVTMAYEPDSKKNFSFELLEEVAIEGFDTIGSDFMYFLYNAAQEPISTDTSPVILQSGNYFISYEISGLALGNCDFEYRIIEEEQNFVFRKN